LKALQEIPGALNQLSETELARVEGGFHGATAAAFFGAAYLYALNHDFAAAANASIAGALIGTQVMHP
jgi:bacteriocin-like protein